MTLSKYCGALDSEIRGTQHLHGYFASRETDLDFFIMLSSLAGIMGNPSQADYAAGNTFQNALTYHRAAKGFPALAIDVDMVTDVGWFAENRAKVGRSISAAAKEIHTKDLTALIEHHVAA